MGGEARARICKGLRSPGIVSEESTPPAYADRARIRKPFKEPRNRFSAWRADTTTLFDALAHQAT